MHKNSTRSVEILPNGERVLHNACVLHALRILLDQPDYQPSRIVSLIDQHGGYPNNKLRALAFISPVDVHMTGQLVLRGTGELVVRDGDTATIVSPDDRVIVIYEHHNPEDGHAECVPVSEIEDFVRGKKVRAVITRKGVRGG